MTVRPGSVTAVLGPTNTGKTHLAIERMCAHSSGIIGFPLRLLAREVYDRVVAIKGANQVALVTGEEKIVPKDARWFLCTAESMPQHETAFLALDEAQLGADPERGHVFTDRLLRYRGREETMILGSEALRPMIRALIPDAEIVARPRFSTLTYAGAKKISRLPKRSVVVAFSAEEVYAVAEMLRRLRGGAAVVMGALSPRTRNAQVAMFQAGEVDYLVATDAIGMGLNMDVAHVAFASLHKFDGRRQRRLTVAEMAQIAGRAGRHQRDGTFGAVTEEGPGAFGPEEVLAIEEHRFPRLDHLYWRDGEPDLSSIDALIASLERKPDSLVLRPAPQALDLGVLKRLADEPGLRDRVRSPSAVARLWAACGIPDFRKVGLDPHTRYVSRIFGWLAEGHIPHQWFADEIARLDTVAGDVETLAGRVAAVRTYAYIAHRPNWLADPAHWAERTRAIEERLSDALHASLTQRFVDKRTTALMRQLGAGASAMPVVIGAEGEVLVEDHPIGRLDGFRFTVASDARAGDKRLLLAAAEKRLGGERAKRAGELVGGGDEAFALGFDESGEPVPEHLPGEGRGPVATHSEVKDGPQPPDSSILGPGLRRGRNLGRDPVIIWQSHPVATLVPGPSPARPLVKLDRALDALEPPARTGVKARLERWLADQLARRVPALGQLADLARDRTVSPGLRVIAGALETAGGIAPRRPLGVSLDALPAAERKALRQAGVTIGALDLFVPALLKPEAARWRRLLLGLKGAPPPLPAIGATVLPRGAPGAVLASGFRPLGSQAVRVDLVERIARGAFDARAGRKPFAPDPALATSMGLEAATLARLMAELGFRHVAPEAPVTESRWVWRGRPPVATAAPVARPDGAFAALAEWARLA
ncbi:helicase-related protein [Sphingomonas sp.]|jgi:ATP-dependent RNA helicase SUPV3L1/SUV3|uniref:helicase-related protein n=1 Tax=Sphingomonas sp. TaxID=28214 RepID=UPI002D81162F|nr:helicase-related protein [Sphingomonas sp.]HEU0045344.1 helicase-related protein [Sphingomonas sp.]